MDVVVLHPGSMGASVGAALRSAGHRAWWVPDGRGPQTAQRARQAGLDAAGALDDAAGFAGAIVSVCPPDAAVAVAREVARRGFAGVYLDGNAVSPATAEQVAATVEAAGASYVDGGIVGPPAWDPGTTRLYLSGPQAGAVAGWFRGGPLEPVVLGGGPYAASALKMAYAAWTKGSAALLLAVRALALDSGVEDALLSEWDTSMPQMREQSASKAASAAPRAWRWVGEMREIASTFRAAGLPGGFHDGAASVYSRLDGFKGSDAPDPAAVLSALRQGAAEPPQESS